MSEADNDQKLFKLMLNSIASDSLRPVDYKVALDSLRNGQMVTIIEQILSALSSSPKRQQTSASADGDATKRRSTNNKPTRSQGRNAGAKSADDLFDDIKRRKVTRDRLVSILNSLDGEAFRSIDTGETMRTIVRDFKDRTSQRQWQVLDSIVNGDYENDPYLESISNHS